MNAFMRYLVCPFISISLPNLRITRLNKDILEMYLVPLLVILFCPRSSNTNPNHFPPERNLAPSSVIFCEPASNQFYLNLVQYSFPCSKIEARRINHHYDVQNRTFLQNFIFWSSLELPSLHRSNLDSKHHKICYTVPPPFPCRHLRMKIQVYLLYWHSHLKLLD